MFCLKAVFCPVVHLLSIKDGKRCQVQDGTFGIIWHSCATPVYTDNNLLETDEAVSRQPFFTVVVVTIPENFLLRDKITRNVACLEFWLSRAMICLLWTASPGVVTIE